MATFHVSTKRRAAGRQALARFRERELASGVVPVAIERPFRFRLGQDQIVGRVDRLDGGPNGVEPSRTTSPRT